jgi:hypothetical protein
VEAAEAAGHVGELQILHSPLLTCVIIADIESGISTVENIFVSGGEDDLRGRWTCVGGEVENYCQFNKHFMSSFNDDSILTKYYKPKL